MAEVHATLRQDFRHYVPKIRAQAKGKVVKSVNDPGVREQIQEALYYTIADKIPVDTGALADSPLAEHQGAHTNGRVIRYANGYISGTNIVFDPFDMYGNHYASRVRGFNPGLWLSRNKKAAYGVIRDILVEDINHAER